jgi:hypothetical protein
MNYHIIFDIKNERQVNMYRDIYDKYGGNKRLYLI